MTSLGLTTSPIASGSIPRVRAPLGRAILLNAILLGLAGDSLLRDGPSGIAFPLWIAVAASTFVAIVWKADRILTVSAGAWLTAAVGFSLGLAWRNSGTLQFFDVLATGACLVMASLRSSGRVADLVRTKVLDLVRAVVSAAPAVIAGLVPPLASTIANSDVDERRTEGGVAVALRAAAITAMLLLVFGSLLRSADPIFASMLSLPEFDAAAFAGHAIFTTFLAWVVAGWVGSAIVDGAPEKPPSLGLPRLGTAEITAAFGALNALFAVFVATQIAFFFGGERFLRDHTGLTVATYARTGFFQMAGVASLIVPVLAGTRALLPNTPAAARRHTALALPLLGLLALMIVSAVVRVKLYVHFYGLTPDRFYGLAFMAWVAFVLAWVVATVLRDRPAFFAGAALSGLAMLAALNAFDPDAFVARVNVDRAAHLGADKLDVPHLATLTGGAVPVATSVVLDARFARDASARCDAARTLLTRWAAAGARATRSQDNGSWRFWNVDDVLAMRTVSRRSAELRTIAHTACAVARAAQPAQR